MARFFTPKGVRDMTPLGMGVFEGHEAIRPFMADWIGAYEDYTVKAERSRRCPLTVIVSTPGGDVRPVGLVLGPATG
jgi:hypothetical protein